MKTSNVELLAAYFTLAGDVYPFGPTEISPFSLRERAEAASAAGWKGMGLIHADLMAKAQKLQMSEIRQIFADNGMKHLELEFLVDWYLDGDRRVASDKFRREILEAAGEIGARSLKVAAGLFDDAPPDLPRMRDEFARVCEDAAQYGVQVVLEVQPFSNIKTLEHGLAIVEGANQPNGGLLLDQWHMVRGGISNPQIAAMPGRFIKSIELDDADRELNGSLWEDTIYHRKLCGEGSFDTSAFIQAVRTAGYDGPFGVEILSETFRKLPLQVMAQSAFDTTMRQFELAAEQPVAAG